METIIRKIDPNQIHREVERKIIKEAGALLLAGEIVAFPTETVYGLGANALSKKAANKIYAAKGRPSDNPLIIHICVLEAIDLIIKNRPRQLELLAKHFWPGPLTIIMEKSEIVPTEITGGLNTVAIRMPNHPVALALIKEGGGYIAAPSANASGRPSPTTAAHVYEDMEGRIPMIIDCGKVEIGLESTIIDLSREKPVILRPGYITPQMLEQVLHEEVIMDPGLLDEKSIEKPRAPGMKYKHYAPKAEMLIVEGSTQKVIKEIQKRVEQDVLQKKQAGIICTDETIKYYQNACCKSIGSKKNPETIASNLFSLLREFDELGVQKIYSECFSEDGLGEAIMNRLMKAASHQIIHV